MMVGVKLPVVGTPELVLGLLVRTVGTEVIVAVLAGVMMTVGIAVIIGVMVTTGVILTIGVTVEADGEAE